jgi:hypothetical protein
LSENAVRNDEEFPTPVERFINKMDLRVEHEVDDSECRFILCRTPNGKPVSIIEWTRLDHSSDGNPDFQVFLPLSDSPARTGQVKAYDQREGYIQFQPKREPMK